MFDNVTIQRNNKTGEVSVFDSDNNSTYCVNTGTRPVDHNFADRVQNQMIQMGYNPFDFRGETTFSKRTH